MGKWRPPKWGQLLKKAVKEIPPLPGRPISHAVLEAGADAMLEGTVSWIETHVVTDWLHELPGSGEEIIKAYLIPIQEVEDLKKG